MRGVAAQRIVRTIRKPRNKADEAIAPKPGWDGAFRAICFVARLANSACYWHRLASRISSRKASVATTRGLFRGSPLRKERPIVARVEFSWDHPSRSFHEHFHEQNRRIASRARVRRSNARHGWRRHRPPAGGLPQWRKAQGDWLDAARDRRADDGAHRHRRYHPATFSPAPSGNA